MKLDMSVADRLVVLNFAEQIAEGSPEAIQSGPVVIAAYLGSAPAAGRDTDPAGQGLDPGLQAPSRITTSQGDGVVVTECMLQVGDVDVSYGNIRALKGVSLEVGTGDIVALLGANGAGEATTQRTVSGMLRPSSGWISYGGYRIDGIPAHELVEVGICHVPESWHVFPRMTVAEHPEVGAARFKCLDQRALDDVLDMFPRLRERYGQLAGTLSGGEQQMLAIGRALMGKPRLLLLDEPSMGPAPLAVEQTFDILRRINAAGVTALLVEQNAAQALAFANRGYVLGTGEIVLSGTGAQLLADERARAAHLGEEIAS
jgi:branched-chain amino acid transport system ATP-binding protein